MDAISEYEVHAPVKIGDVLVNNITGLDINIIATKNVKKLEDLDFEKNSP
jgi:CxxC motif-containing protein